MSSSVLQKPLCSALTILYPENNINNDVLIADKVSCQIYDRKKNIKGKISYFISNGIKKKINYNDKLIFKILYGNINILSSISIITYGIDSDIIFNNNTNT